MTARAGDISIESDETSGTEDALQEQSESAAESEPEAEEPKPGVIESEEPEKPDAGEKEPDTEEKESEEPDVEEKEPEASEPEKEEPDQELTEPEGRSEEPEEEQTEEVLNSVELKAEADGYEFLLKGTTDQLTSAEADLKLIVEPMKEELEKAAAEKVMETLDEGRVIESLEGYQLKIFDGSKEIGLVDGGELELTVKETEALKELKAKENNSEAEVEAELDLYDLNEAEPKCLTPPEEEIPAEDRKVLKEDELLKADIEKAGALALVYTVEKVEEVETEIELSTVVNDVEITLRGPREAFPEEGELSLEAEEITDERLEEAKAVIEEQKETGEEKIQAFRLFDIKLLADQEEIQPLSAVKVGFKNLELEKENGETIDALECVQAEKYTEEVAEKTREVTKQEEKLTVYHFEDETNAVELDTDVEEAQLFVETEHFSEYAVAYTEFEDHSTTDTYIGNGGKYTLEYIFSNYNVFVEDSFGGLNGEQTDELKEANHVVGPMIVGGETYVSGLGGSSGKGDELEIIPHKVSSYWRGEIKGSINTITTDSKVPEYMGTENQLKKGDGSKRNWFLVDNHYPQNTTEYQYYNYYFTDGYIDFDEAFTQLNADAQRYMEFQGYDDGNHYIKQVTINQSEIDRINAAQSGTYGDLDEDGYRITYDASRLGACVTLRLGNNYSFGTFAGVVDIEYAYDEKNPEEFESTLTIISTEQGGEVQFPKLYKIDKDGIGPHSEMESRVENGPKCSIVYLLPKADVINTAKNGEAGVGSVADASVVGHIYAPNAVVRLASGNNNGCVIANRVESKAEFHMWPSGTGPSTNQDAAIMLNKVLDGKSPDGKIFQFTLEQIIEDGEEKAFEPITVTSSPSGWISFKIHGLDAEIPYRVKITEEQPQEDIYLENDQTFYAEFKIVPSDDNLNGYYTDITWYTDESFTEELEVDHPTFENRTKRELLVEKRWKDSDGTELEAASRTPVNFILKRYTEKDIDVTKVQTVTYEIWLRGMQTEPQGIKVGEIQNTYVATDEIPLKLHVECVKKVSESTDAWRAAGIYGVDVGSNEITDVDIGQGSIVLNAINTSGNTTSKWLNPGAFVAAGDVTVEKPIENNKVKVTFICEDANLESLKQLEYYEVKPISGNSDLIFTGNGVKINANGEPDEKAVFTLNEANNWKQKFENLLVAENGELYYYQVEELPEKGFQVSYDNQITDGSGITTITNTKKVEKMTLQVNKVDESNKPLKGAKFQLSEWNGTSKTLMKFTGNAGVYQPNASGTQELQCDENGHLKINQLSFGEYILEETKAPDGYQLEKRLIYIKIKDGQNVFAYINTTEDIENLSENDYQDLTKEELTYSLSVVNRTGVVLPDTGGFGINEYLKEGVLFTGMGLLMILLYEYLRRRKGNIPVKRM